MHNALEILQSCTKPSRYGKYFMQVCSTFHLNMMMSWNGTIFHVACVWGILRSIVDSPHKGQWHGILMFSFICTWTNSLVNHWDPDDLRHHHDRYDIIIMIISSLHLLSMLCWTVLLLDPCIMRFWCHVCCPNFLPLETVKPLILNE